MKTGIIKKIAALVIGFVSAFAAALFFSKARSQKEEAAQNDNSEPTQETGLSAADSHSLHIPESSVRKTSVIKRPRTASKTRAGDSKQTVKVLNDMFDDLKEKSMTNESIAKIITSLIHLQNVVDPERAIDVRNIHFMTYGKQNTMVIELYTDNFSTGRYESELNRLWSDVFLAEDFWNADFVKVRINVRDAKSDSALESISCGLDDVKRYLLNEVSMDEFRESWTRKKAAASKTKEASQGKKTKSKSLKRA